MDKELEKRLGARYCPECGERMEILEIHYREKRHSDRDLEPDYIPEQCEWVCPECGHKMIQEL